MQYNLENAVSLNHGEYDHVKFTDKDNHVFFMEMGKAIEFCRRQHVLEADLEQDGMEFVDIWTQWLPQNKAFFSAVLVRPQAESLILFFAPTGSEFDVKLSMGLADLESEAVSRLHAMKIETRQVSAVELEELREMEKVRRHADQGSAHQPVEA